MEAIIVFQANAIRQYVAKSGELITCPRSIEKGGEKEYAKWCSQNLLVFTDVNAARAAAKEAFGESYFTNGYEAETICSVEEPSQSLKDWKAENKVVVE